MNTALSAYVRQYGIDGALDKLDTAIMTCRDRTKVMFFSNCYRILNSSSVQGGRVILDAQRTYWRRQ